MIIAIVGSRNFKDLFAVDVYLNKSSNLSGVVTGDARGVDQRAVFWCKQMKVPCEVIKPLFNTPKYYLYRNVEIIKAADKIVAFWDGKSTGTAFVVSYALARGKPVEVIRDD